MIYEALIEKHPYSFICKKHNVRVQSISLYVNKAKRNPKFLKELYSKEQSRQDDSDEVVQYVQKMIATMKVIPKV